MQLTWKGEQQEGRVGKPLEPFEILAQEEGGDRLPHVPVEFVVAEGTGTFTYKDEITDQGGNAIAEFVPSKAGRYRVECFIGEDKREMVPFKGIVASDRRKRTSRPPPPTKPAAAPEPPVIIVAVSLPPAAPVTEPKPALTTEVKPPTPVATVPAAKPAPQHRRREVGSEKREVRSKPSGSSPLLTPHFPPGTPPPSGSGIKGLLIAVIVIFALLVPLTAALVIQNLARPQPVVECSGDSWRLTGDTLVFPKCVTTMR